MKKYLLICPSLTYAQLLASSLDKAGISNAVIRTPREFVRGGCGYNVRVFEKNYARARAVAASSGVRIDRIVEVSEEGKYTEVKP